MRCGYTANRRWPGQALFLALVSLVTFGVALAACADDDDGPPGNDAEEGTRTASPDPTGDPGAGGTEDAEPGSEEGTVSSGSACEDSGAVGRWDGSFQSPSGLNGTVTLSLALDGCAVSGSSVFTDAPCFSAADFRGSLAPLDGGAWRFEGELYGEMSRGGELLVDVSGTLDMGEQPARGEFDYLVLVGGVCTGNAGTISIEKP